MKLSLLSSTAATILLAAHKVSAADCWALSSGTYQWYNSGIWTYLWQGREYIAYNCGFPNSKACIYNLDWKLAAWGTHLNYHVYVAAEHTPNQGYWWDISQQIMDQCVFERPASNGGLIQRGAGGQWTYGDVVGKIGFWFTNESASKRRDVVKFPSSGNVTLSNGDVISEGRIISQDENGVAFAFDILEDGSHVPFDLVIPPSLAV